MPTDGGIAKVSYLTDGLEQILLIASPKLSQITNFQGDGRDFNQLLRNGWTLRLGCGRHIAATSYEEKICGNPALSREASRPKAEARNLRSGHLLRNVVLYKSMGGNNNDVEDVTTSYEV